MNRSVNILLISTIFIVSATVLAQTSAQSGTQANAQASVQANQTQVRTSGEVASSSSAWARSNQANAGLASGTTFNATLDSSVDAKKSKPGDAVIAHMTESVKSDGKTILPKNTKLVGHITQASVRAQGEAESTLAITFDRAILKSGQEAPLNVAIQAIASPQTAASASEADIDTMGSMGASAIGSGMARSRGTVGGLTSTAASAVGSVTTTAAVVGGTAGLAAGSPGTAGGLNAAGRFTSNSRGAFGLNGVSLNSVAANNTQGSLITSAGKNVRLDSGTRMLMVTQTSASATPAR